MKSNPGSETGKIFDRDGGVFGVIERYLLKFCKIRVTFF
jgi:hypothetical protein